jgi:hypothetical protein
MEMEREELVSRVRKDIVGIEEIEEIGRGAMVK